MSSRVTDYCQVSYRDIIREMFALFRGTGKEFAKKAHIRDTYLSALMNEAPKASGSEGTAANAVQALWQGKTLEIYLQERAEAKTEDERELLGKLLFIVRHDPPRAEWIKGNIVTFYEQSLAEVRKRSERPQVIIQASKDTQKKVAGNVKGRGPPDDKSLGKIVGK